MTGDTDLDYEVFVRTGGEGRAIVHVGSVRGHDPFLAWHSAREVYTRREDATLLWVVPRSAIVADGEHHGTLGQGLRRSYRLPTYPGQARRSRESRQDAP